MAKVRPGRAAWTEMFSSELKLDVVTNTTIITIFILVVGDKISRDEYSPCIEATTVYNI